jgi:hypothetical protein
MKLLIMLLLVLPITATAPQPPAAIAKFCVNQVVERLAVKWAKVQARFEGCDTVTVVPVDDNHFLVYGVKVYIGE